MSSRAYRKFEKNKQYTPKAQNKKEEEETVDFSSSIERNSFHILSNANEEEDVITCEIEEVKNFEDDKMENEEENIQDRKMSKKKTMNFKMNTNLEIFSDLSHFSINFLFTCGNTEFYFFNEFILTTMRKLQKIGIDLKDDDIHLVYFS
jgi:hypothetical protein